MSTFWIHLPGLSTDNFCRERAAFMNRVLLPLMTSILFSGSYIAGKYTTLDMGPLTTTLWRYLIALVFLSGLLLHYKRSALVLQGRDIVPALLLGLFGIVGYHYFFFLSLRYTEVANTAIINALSPVLTSVAAAFLIKERLSRRNYAGVLVAFFGVLILLCRGDIDAILAVRFNKGDLLMLLSVISWMIYALLIRTMLEKYSGFTLTFYATLFGVLMLLFLAPQEAPLDRIQEISRASLLSVFYMGICGSGLGYLLYNLSIREIGPTRTSSFVYSVIPVIVAVLALMFFQQAITPIMIASMILILIGLHMMLVERRKASTGNND
jgi:drug/metabolite transporter (DMT)-like permease